MNLNLDKRRPCFVNGQKAMFHCWRHASQVISPSPLFGGHPGGVVSETYGIVEYEDGSIAAYVEPGSIRFADGGGFDEIAFSEVD